MRASSAQASISERASSRSSSGCRATPALASEAAANGHTLNGTTTSSIQRRLMRKTSAASSEFIGHRQEGHLVVRLAKPSRQRAHEVPQQLVRQVAVDEQQVLEVFLADHEQAALLVHD